jgi:hypothetical protein
MTTEQEELTQAVEIICHALHAQVESRIVV